ncbi:hypothetical protein SCHPADRAFT_446036 [Schizopora paradoxa]|uniref:Uncharacterized protein n=1 Tax=Schizopora paradoxa TaxID=27342 RepID=A0A0H2S4T7_9AGAM|nr:hypothetical protein SCHPADRAFT_446036 [Schizopora paradoxa]
MLVCDQSRAHRGLSHEPPRRANAHASTARKIANANKSERRSLKPTDHRPPSLLHVRTTSTSQDGSVDSLLRMVCLRLL